MRKYVGVAACTDGPKNYADYGTSSYARRESALTKAELDAIEQFGLSDLSVFLGKKPTADDIKIIHEMFEASVDGEAYDTEKWGNFYRPIGLKNDKDTELKSETFTEPTDVEPEVSHAESTSVAEASATPVKTSAADILEKIKNRGKATKATA